MMIPFPWDWMGYWLDKYKLTIPRDALMELEQALLGNFPIKPEDDLL